MIALKKTEINVNVFDISVPLLLNDDRKLKISHADARIEKIKHCACCILEEVTKLHVNVGSKLHRGRKE